MHSDDHTSRLSAAAWKQLRQLRESRMMPPGFDSFDDFDTPEPTLTALETQLRKARAAYPGLPATLSAERVLKPAGLALVPSKRFDLWDGDGPWMLTVDAKNETSTRRLPTYTTEHL